jgi:hypothetical protein
MTMLRLPKTMSVQVELDVSVRGSAWRPLRHETGYISR